MRSRYFVLAQLLGGAALCLSIAQGSYAAEAHELPSSTVVPAIWQEHDLRFKYSGTTTHYKCDELGRRVAAILRALGARDGMTLQVRCNSNFAGHGELDVKLATPVEATAANVERETTFDATEQLAARVRGQTLPSATDVERFPAIRKQVVLTKNRALDIRYNDCDLLQGMRRQLFAQLDIRVVARSFRCDPEPSHIRPKIIVEALLPVEHVG
jgi:hypothetical protein